MDSHAVRTSAGRSSSTRRTSAGDSPSSHPNRSAAVSPRQVSTSAAHASRLAMRGSSTTVSPRLSVSPGSSSPSSLSVGLSLIRTSDHLGGADVPGAPASMQCRRRPRVPPLHGLGRMTKQGPHEIAAGLWRRRGSNGSAAGIMRNSREREREAEGTVSSAHTRQVKILTVTSGSRPTSGQQFFAV